MCHDDGQGSTKYMTTNRRVVQRVDLILTAGAWIENAVGFMLLMFLHVNMRGVVDAAPTVHLASPFGRDPPGTGDILCDVVREPRLSGKGWGMIDSKSIYHK